MNPDSFSSTYKRYKADTQIFTTWLTQIAIDKGYSPHLSESKTPKSNEFKSTVGITVAQLLDQAKYLSRQNPPPSIPRDIAAAGKRALLERYKCRDWYSAFSPNKTTTDDTLETGNSGYEHSINTLERILHMLKPEIAPSGASTEAEKAKPKTSVNVYELLEMEESVEEDLLPLSAWQYLRKAPIKHSRILSRRQLPSS